MNTTATAAAHTERAAAHAAEALASYERCGTDGFVSQAAHGIMSNLERARAEVAADGGTAEFDAIFDLDGQVISTHRGHGQYGEYWVLNDEAAERMGRRFVSQSFAQKDERRRAANRAKGFTVGTIRAAAYADTHGNGGRGTGGMLSVTIVVLPVVADLLAGNYEVITTEN